MSYDLQLPVCLSMRECETRALTNAVCSARIASALSSERVLFLFCSVWNAKKASLWNEKGAVLIHFNAHASTE